jgi:hypothetical protein
MVTSTAYRQTSAFDPARKAHDPGNILLGAWRPRRHEGEVVRDSVLAVAGKLSDHRHGPPAPVTQKGDGSVETSDDVQGNRRSVYVVVRRSQHLTLFDLFDTPLMEVNCPERNVSTVPAWPHSRRKWAISKGRSSLRSRSAGTFSTTTAIR